MFVVISYDIADDRRRRQVAKICENYGLRVQESVFDGLLDEGRLLELRNRLIEEIDQELDSIRFYRICERCRREIDVIGLGTVQDDHDVVIL